MLKKILTIVLLVGFTSLLIYGGVNRTLAMSGDGEDGLWLFGKGASRTSTETQDYENHEDGEAESGFQNGGGLENNSIRENNTVDKSQQSLGKTNGGNNSQGSNQGKGGNVGTGGGSGQGGGYEPLEEAEIEALHLALEDEYHALAVYQSVILDYGEVAPFVEIYQSEQRHIDSLLKQFEKHDIPIPENTWLGNILSYESLQAACKAGVDAELANIALYEQLLTMTDDPGLLQVFTNLSRASLESHLPEFQSCQ